MSNTTNTPAQASRQVDATRLSYGQCCAVQVLVGIDLDILSTLCEQDAKTLLETGSIMPCKTLNLSNEASRAKKAIIAEGKVAQAQQIASRIVEEYKLLPADADADADET